MGDVQAVSGLDRLPWLADEPRMRGPRRRAWPLLLGALVAALAAFAGAVYWFGPASQPAPPVTQAKSSPVTVPLPAPREAPPPAQPQIALDPPPLVEPVAAPPSPSPVVREAPKVPKASRTAVRRTVRAKAPPRATRTARKQAAEPTAVAAKTSAAPALWPVRAEQNSAGRLVRIGRFTTPRKAKRGWHQIARAYPGMKRLPALVVPIRGVPSGRRYYRLQMGTTSQAHSEVLCQRMRAVHLSCVVLDIPPTKRTRR